MIQNELILLTVLDAAFDTVSNLLKYVVVAVGLSPKQSCWYLHGS